MYSNSNHSCFIETLMKLRESSKDAVVSSDFIDDYTMYMHVDRPIQEKFEQILRKSADSDHAELIMLCGSVGDGKSHMLQVCKHKFPELMEQFYVHNDSTASLYIDKPASYTLQELLDDFSDENLETSFRKVILAINLGTLSNFLEQDTQGRFSKLSEYVYNAGILDRIEESRDDSIYFHSVNFADYHLYELTADGPQSAYISAIIDKITRFKNDNVFYNSYYTCCKECEASSLCPVKKNYELLSKKEIKSGIVDVVIESIVKNKLIISTRTLMNFIYEILVDERSFDTGSLEPRKEPYKITQLQYIEALLPCTFYNRPAASELLSVIHGMDPVNYRNEKLDEFFIYYENYDNPIEMFKENLSSYFDLVNRFCGTNFLDPAMYEIKSKLLYLYVRLSRLIGENPEEFSDNGDYKEYMSILYNWNIGNHMALKNTYSDIEKGILSWNGSAGKNEMQIDVANRSSGFHLYQSLEIKVVLNNNTCGLNDILFSFSDEISLKYKNKHKNIVCELIVDYALYKLLKRIINGYVPSIEDKRINVRCTDFVRQIARGGSKMESLTIRDLSQKEEKQYRFEYDENFGYSFEEI